MKLLMNEICQFAQSTPTSRNYREGESILNSDHVIYCGKYQDESVAYRIIAYCIQSSSIREHPHEINGIIKKNGIIEKMQCSCKAGLSETCKHIVAVLLYLNRKNFETLEVASCTDKKCLWKIPHKTALEVYDPVPLEQHKCFQKNFAAVDKITFSEEMLLKIKGELLAIDEKSAIAKHSIGRHDSLHVLMNNNNINQEFSEEIKILLSLQESNLMKSLSELEVGVVQSCCEYFVKTLDKDAHELCMRTKRFHSEWMKERQCRITGSRCYELFTYAKNKKANWKKKTDNYWCPKPITNNRYLKHGLENEPLARVAYEAHFGVTVAQLGLVLSKQNPWVVYSQDGVVFKDGKPWKLIEIKCPFDGKTMPINKVVKRLTWIELNEKSEVTLKHRQYYAQIQFGMAVLNVKSTDFIIYSPLDNQFLLFNLDFDEIYCQNLFQTLKFVYFQHMCHQICQNE